MAEEEKELFRSSSLTARKQHVSTQSESELKTSTKRSIRRFDKEFLFNTSIESSNMTMMNLFQQEQGESLRSQESSRSEQSQEEKSRSQDEDLKSRSSSSEMTFQQQYEFKMMKMRLEMMKLEVQKLTDQKELTERDISFQFSISNKFSASVY